MTPKDLYKYMNNYNLVDMTQESFLGYFKNSNFQDLVYNKLVEGNNYDGSKAQFLADFGGGGLPSGLRSKDVFVEGLDGNSATVLDRSNDIAKNRQSKYAAEEMSRLISDLASNSILSERARERAANITMIKSGEDTYDFFGFGNQKIATLDYTGFMLSSDTRQNRIGDAMNDIVTWTQEDDIREITDPSMRGAGLNFNAPLYVKDATGNLTGFTTMTTPSFSQRDIRKPQYAYDPSLDVSAEAGALTNEQLQQIQQEGATITSGSAVPFDYGMNAYGSEDFNMKSALENAPKKEFIINGKTYKPTEQGRILGEPGANMSVSFNAVEITKDPETGEVTSGKEQLITLSSKYQLEQFSRGKTNLDYSDDEYSDYAFKNIMNRGNLLLNNAMPENEKETLVRIQNDVNQYVTSLPIQQITQEDREKYKMVLEGGEVKYAENKQEMYNYLLDKALKENFPAMEDYSDFEALVSRVSKGGKISYGGVTTEMNPFDNTQFMHPDADYTLGELIEFAGDDHLGFYEDDPRATILSKISKLKSFFGDDPLMEGNRPEFLGFSEFKILGRDLAQNRFNMAKMRRRELEDYQAIQDQLTIYAKYFNDARDLAILTGDGEAARIAEQRLNKIIDISDNLVDSRRFLYLDKVQAELEKPIIPKVSKGVGIAAKAVGTAILPTGAPAILNSSIDKFGKGVGYLTNSVIGKTILGLAGMSPNFSPPYLLGKGVKMITGEDNFLTESAKDITAWASNTADDLETAINYSIGETGVPVLGKYVEYDGYKIYLDDGPVPAIRKSWDGSDMIFSIDGDIVPSKDKREIAEKALADNIFADHAVKANSWYNPNISAVSSQVAKVSTDLLVLLYGGGAATNVVKRGAQFMKLIPKGSKFIPRKARQLGRLIPSSMIIAGQTFNGLRKEAIASGFTEEEANSYASRVGLGIGLINMMVGGLEKNLVGFGVSKAIPPITAASRKLGVTEAAKQTTAQYMKSMGVSAIKEGALETFEETYLEHWWQQGYHAYATSQSPNEIEDLQRTADEQYETALISFIVGAGGGGMSKGNQISSISNLENQEIDQLMFSAAKTYENSTKAIEKLKADGHITDEVQNQLKEKLDLAQRVYNRMSSSIRSSEVVGNVYDLNMLAEKLEIEANNETNETLKEVKNKEVQQFRDAADALTVAEEAGRTKKQAYILNGKVVTKEDILKHFENGNKETLIRTDYEVINDRETTNLINSRTASMKIVVNETPIVFEFSKEARAQRIMEKRNQVEANKTIIQKNIDKATKLEAIIQPFNEDTKQGDGSYVFEYEPTSGVEYSVKRTGILRRKSYVVSKEEAQRFLSQKNRELEDTKDLIESLRTSNQETTIDLDEIIEKIESEQDTAPVEDAVPVDEDATIEEEPTIEELDVRSALGREYERDGVKGTLNLDGQTVVFETEDQIIEIGNVDEIGSTDISQFNIKRIGRPPVETKKVKVKKGEPTKKKDEFTERLEEPFAKGESVSVKTQSTLEDNVLKTTFTQTISDEKGPARTQNFKTYNSLQELAENLDVDLETRVNQLAATKYEEAENKEIQLVEIRQNQFKDSPNFGERFATILIDGKKVDIKIDEGFKGDVATSIESMTQINKDVFGLGNKKAKAAAVIIDRMVEAMAKRDGVSKEEMYKKISFRRSPGGLPKTVNTANVLFQADYSARDSKITFTFFKNSKEFDDAVKAGLIQKDVSIESLDGKTAVFHQPDDASVSNFIYKGETILKGRGGALYPIMFKQDVGEKQSVWASTGEAAAKGLVNLINESGASNEDGVARLVLTTGSRTKNLSNSNSMEGVASIFRAFSNNPDFGINENTYKKSVVAAMKKAGIENNLTTKNSLDEIITTIQVVSRPENTNFQQRKTFNEQLITEILSRSNNNANSKFVKSMKSFFADTGYKLYVSNRRNLALKKGDEGGLVNGFAYLLGEPVVRDLTSNGSGQAYAVIEVTRPEGVAPDAPLVEAVADDAHGSYPFAIKTIYPQSKVSVKFFDKTSPRENIVENPNKQGERFSDTLSNLEQGRPRKSAHGKVFPGQAGVSSSILKMMTKSPVAQETEKEIVKADIEEATSRMESQDGATSTVLDEDKEMSVLPLPERFLLGYEEATGKSVSEKDKQSFLYKLGRKFKYQPGGVFVDMKQFKAVNNFTGTSARISVDPETGKPSLSVSDNISETDVTKGKGKIIRVNLFKKSAGWKWTANFDGNTYENLDKIVSVKVGSKHIYTLNFDGAVPVTLKSYPKEPSEPRLKPTTRGSVHLGPIIGEITRNNITNPVYSTVTVFDPNDKATIDRLIERAQSRSNSAILPTQENYESHQLKDVPESFVKFQDNKGAMLSKDGRHIIFALTDPDVSTPLHEMAHVYENYLSAKEKKTVIDFAGESQWNRKVSEKFARGFEKYLAEGVAPSKNLQKIFNSFRSWLTSIYNGITASDIDIELNDDMRAIYAKMLGGDIVTAKKAAPQAKATEPEPSAEQMVDEAPETETEVETVTEKEKQVEEPTVKPPSAREVTKPEISSKRMESLSKLSQELNSAVNKAKGLEGKKMAVKAVIRRYSKDLNMAGTLDKTIQGIEKASNEKVLKQRIDTFKKRAKKRAEKPGDDITINDAKALKDKLRELNKVTRMTRLEAKQAKKRIVEAVTKELRARKVKLDGKRARIILNKIKNINLNDPNAITRFEEYIDNVMADIEYDKKLTSANILRRNIKKRAKNDTLAGDTKVTAKDFGAIIPSMVKNIDEYLANAVKVYEGLGRVIKTKKKGVKEPEAFNNAEINAYTILEMDKQMQTKINEIKSILEAAGVDTSNMTLSDMKKAMKVDPDVKVDQAKEYVNMISSLFKSYESAVDREIERRGLTGIQAQLASDLVRVDLSLLRNKDMVTMAYNVLNNFLENGTTYGMLEIISYHDGRAAAIADQKQGVKGRNANSGMATRLLGDSVKQLQLFFSDAYAGNIAGNKVMTTSGVNDFIRGANSGLRIVDDYRNEYLKLRDGNKKLRKYLNSYKSYQRRGMLAFASRIDSEMTEDVSFGRRKELILESIERIEKFDSDKGKMQREAYEEIIENAKSIDDIRARMTREEVKLVDYWVERFSNHTEEIKSVVENYYNQTFSNDRNYFPDTYIILDSAVEQEAINRRKKDDEKAASAQFVSDYDSRATITEQAIKPKRLPSNRVIDFNFDDVAYRKLREGLIDVRTVAAKSKINAYFNSNEFIEMVNGKENADRLRNSVTNYITSKRNEKINPPAVDKEDIKKVGKYLNRVAGLGYFKGLFSLSQPFKQYFPAISSTVVQAGSFAFTKDALAVWDVNSEENKAIDRSGYSIANRGYGSRADYSVDDRVYRELSPTQNLADTVTERMAQITEFGLKVSVNFADRLAARQSFIAFYQQRLHKMGLDYRNIDWATHKWNEEAASYADMQVSINQNASDESMKGRLYTNRNVYVDTLRKIFIPFSSFRQNARVRLYNDIRIVSSQMSTIEDKRISARQIGGTLSEQALYTGIQYMTYKAIVSTAMRLLGFKDEEKCEDKVKFMGSEVCLDTLNDLAFFNGGRIINDYLNPLPFMDESAIKLYNTLASLASEDEEQDPLFYERKDSTAGTLLSSFGLFSIVGEGMYETFKILQAIKTGKYTYTDNFGKHEVEFSPESLAVLRPAGIIGGIMLISGVMPKEVRSLMNRLVKTAAKMGPDHKYSDAYIDELYGPIMEELNMTRDELMEYVDFELNDKGVRTEKFSPEKEYSDETLEYLKIHNRQEYDRYMKISEAIKNVEEENRIMKTLGKALDEYTIEYLYGLMLQHPDEFEKMSSIYGFTKTMVEEEISRKRNSGL